MFSQAFFKAFKQPNPFWCFVFSVTLFNLQGTRRVLRRFHILALTQSFVKNFFQVFSNFFVPSFARSSFVPRCLADSFDRLPQPFLFVNTFFQVFSNFFRRRSESVLGLPASGKLAYLIRLFSRCQRHFSRFFRFFHPVHFSPISSCFLW